MRTVGSRESQFWTAVVRRLDEALARLALLKDEQGSDRDSPVQRPTGDADADEAVESTVEGKTRRLEVTPAKLTRSMEGEFAKRSESLLRMVARTIKAQRDTITDAEAVAAARSGEPHPAWQQRWIDAYAEAVSVTLDPHWKGTATASGKIMLDALKINDDERRDVVFDLFGDTLERWTSERGGQLAVDLTESQHRGLRAILRHFTVDNPVSVDRLAQFIGPVVGLTERDAARIRRLTDALREDGMSEADALAAAQREANKMRRRRAKVIAHTELAYAHNFGAFSMMKAADESGEFPGERVVKRWYTQLDERVCYWCGPLHDVVVGMETTFPGKTKRVPNTFAPPAHPNCRCVLLYEFQELE